MRGNGVGQGHWIRHDIEGQFSESPAVRAGDGRSDRDDARGAPSQYGRLDELALALEAPNLPCGVMERSDHRDPGVVGGERADDVRIEKVRLHEVVVAAPERSADAAQSFGVDE
jgi:hypothetical protein